MENPVILIVEDDKNINDLIAYNLRNKGFLVEQIFDGVIASERLKNALFPIVILDIMLPGIDGFDICRDIKSSVLGGRSYVVMISAKASEQDKLHAHILGADCYLTKPFSVGSLISVIEEISGFIEKEFSVKLGK
jgi:DNA-binding response OmpR family regulator